MPRNTTDKINDEENNAWDENENDIDELLDQADSDEDYLRLLDNKGAKAAVPPRRSCCFVKTLACFIFAIVPAALFLGYQYGYLDPVVDTVVSRWNITIFGIGGSKDDDNSIAGLETEEQGYDQGEEQSQSTVEEEGIKRIAILAERYSGASWLTVMLAECFPDVEVTPNLSRMSHWFQDPAIHPLTSPTLVISISLNIYNWIDLMHQHPLYAPNHIDMNWETFLTTPWTMARPQQDIDVLDRYDSICQSQFSYYQVVPCIINEEEEALYEMNVDGSGGPYTSILDLRSDKILNFASVEHWDNVTAYIPIKYEDLMQDHGLASLLEDIEHKTNMKRVCSSYFYDRSSPPMPYVDKGEMQDVYDKQFVNFINENTNWMTEAMIGYKVGDMLDLPTNTFISSPTPPPSTTTIIIPGQSDAFTIQPPTVSPTLLSSSADEDSTNAPSSSPSNVIFSSPSNAPTYPQTSSVSNAIDDTNGTAPPDNIQITQNQTVVSSNTTTTTVKTIPPILPTNTSNQTNSTLVNTTDSSVISDNTTVSSTTNINQTTYPTINTTQSFSDVANPPVLPTNTSNQTSSTLANTADSSNVTAVSSTANINQTTSHAINTTQTFSDVANAPVLPTNTPNQTSPTSVNTTDSSEFANATTVSSTTILNQTSPVINTTDSSSNVVNNNGTNTTSNPPNTIATTVPSAAESPDTGINSPNAVSSTDVSSSTSVNTTTEALPTPQPNSTESSSNSTDNNT